MNYSTQDLNRLLQEASVSLRQQQEHINELSRAPWKVAQVLQVDSECLRISVEGQLFETLIPSHLSKVQVGDYLRLNPESGAVVAASTIASSTGIIGTVQQVHLDGQLEVEEGGMTKIVCPRKDLGTTNVGDRVLIVDDTIAVRNLGRAEEKYLFRGETQVTWNEIGGLDLVKDQMIEALEMPFRYPELYRTYGKKPTKGILLFGQPGNGKTLLAKAAATSIAKLHGHSASTGFISVKGPELLNMYVGNTEAAIRSLFQMGREHKARNGYPAVLFIDEADSVLARRGSGSQSFLMNTTVPQFLVEMDGIDESGCLVILATNRQDTLDSAVLRDGRIDHRILVTPPTRESAAQILHLNLRNRPVNGSRDQLTELAVEGLFAEERVLYEIKTKKEEINFLLSNSLNGAMVTAVVENAVERAFKRDRQQAGKTKAKGVCPVDMSEAVDHIFKEQKKMNHEEQLQEFVESFRKDLVDVRKVA